MKILILPLLFLGCSAEAPSVSLDFKGLGCGMQHVAQSTPESVVGFDDGECWLATPSPKRALTLNDAPCPGIERVGMPIVVRLGETVHSWASLWDHELGSNRYRAVACP